jgi:hypothetical protein
MGCTHSGLTPQPVTTQPLDIAHYKPTLQVGNKLYRDMNALSANTTGNNNVATGLQALLSNTTGAATYSHWISSTLVQHYRWHYNTATVDR